MAGIFEHPIIIENARYITLLDGQGGYLKLPKITTTQRDRIDAKPGMLIFNETTNQVEVYQSGTWGALGGGSSGSTTFLALTDTPTDYTGGAGLAAKVNATENALEFAALDHGAALTGLGDDDHPQYLLANGARALAGNISAAGYDITDVGKLNFDDATTLTIAAGVVTITQTYHFVDTEAAATTDDLDTINGGTAGDVIYIRAADSTRTVVIKHGTGNIVTPDGLDYSLDDANKLVALLFDGTNWHLIGSAGGSSSGTDPNAIHDNVAGEIAAITEKTSPTSSDLLLIEDAAASNAKKKAQIGNLPLSASTVADETIYVDSTNGSDVTGDGSSAAPYRSINHALSVIPGNIKHKVTIHLVASSTAYDAFDMENFVSTGGEIILEGEGTVLTTGTVSSLTEEVNDPVYGSAVLVDRIDDSSAAWTTNAYQWKLLRLYKTGYDDIYRLITYNDATGLYVMADFNTGYDSAIPDNTWSYQILDWGAQVNNPSSIKNILCPVTMKNVYFVDFTGGDLLHLGPSFTNIEIVGCKFARNTNAGAEVGAEGGLGLTARHSIFTGSVAGGIHITGSINVVYSQACYYNAYYYGLWIEINGEGRGRIQASRFEGCNSGIDGANATFVMHPLDYDALNVFDSNGTGIRANRYGYFLHTAQCHFVGNTTDIDTTSDYSGASTGV